MSELKGVESIFEIQVGDYIQVEQEIEVNGQKQRKLGQPFEVRQYNYQNIVLSIQSGRKFKVVQ